MRKFIVRGMSCAACVANVERAVKRLDGVISVSVNLLTNSMQVEGSASDDDIINAVERAGYNASVEGAKKVNDSNGKEDNKELKTLLVRLISSVVFLIVLMYFSMGVMMWSFPLPAIMQGNYLAVGLLQLVLCTIILIINKNFFINGFKGIIHGSVNMDTLVAMGSGVAFAYSLYALFAMTDAQVNGDMVKVLHYAHELYFESSAMILTLITIGKTLETYSKGKTTSALKALMKLAPKTANLYKNGEEVSVAIDSVMVGDIFIVRAGESIPVDGEIIEGSASINESVLTGESIPNDKEIGDKVSAGTINLNGYIKCRALRVGEDTTLNQIIKLVSDASSTKAPVARVADKVSAVFVPCVIAISAITLIVWGAVSKDIGYSLARAISVLVISCPCALGLATPVAIMVGNGVGARNGILFKNSTALEHLSRAQIVVLDKTGTITKGEPVVTDILPKDMDRISLLTYAYLIESKSEHPLSRAIIKCAHQEGICITKEVDDFEILSGNGLKAIVDGVELVGGKLDFVKSRADITLQDIDSANALANEGKTPLYFAYNGKFIGIIAVADTVREDSIQAIEQLKEMGLHTVMLTGDNAITANAIGKIAGTDEVVAGVLPNDKANVIKRLQEYGKVAMVGDGINDAPALTCADIGIAIGAGSDIAIDAADVVLVKSELKDVPAAIRLSRSTLIDIYQNLFWAFIYNTIGIPLAAGVWIPVFNWELNPMFGAAAMSLSSVCVVLNALRLNLVKIHKPRAKKQCKLPLTNGKLLQEEIKEEQIMTKITLHVDGIMCPHCENRVKNCLLKIEGIEEAVVSHVEGTAIITTSMAVDMDAIANAINQEGYKFIG